MFKYQVLLQYNRPCLTVRSPFSASVIISLQLKRYQTSDKLHSIWIFFFCVHSHFTRYSYLHSIIIKCRALQIKTAVTVLLNFAFYE
jgi:hypothetical protein